MLTTRVSELSVIHIKRMVYDKASINNWTVLTALTVLTILTSVLLRGFKKVKQSHNTPMEEQRGTGCIAPTHSRRWH
jgi:hypothetical protein